MKQRLVEASRSGQLHAANSAWDGHDRYACQAEGRGVAEQAASRLAVIGANCQACYRSCREQDQLVRGKQLIHAIAEGFVALVQGRDFRTADARAPFEPLANRDFKAVEVAGVDASSLKCLNGSEDLEGVCPPAGVDPGTVQAKGLDSANRAFQIGENLRFAVMVKAFRYNGEASEVFGPCLWLRGEKAGQ